MEALVAARDEVPRYQRGSPSPNANVNARIEAATAAARRCNSNLDYRLIMATAPHPKKDPISRKKLEKGDACFDIEKEILGFLINGADRTVRLSEQKAKSITDDISKILKKSHIPLKRFRSILGRLQHAARIIPAAKGLFTPLNKATVGDPAQVGVGKESEVRAALVDLRLIVMSLASRPTHVSELVEHEPDLAGTCDASAAGAGGIWVGHGIQPTVWRLEWP